MVSQKSLPSDIDIAQSHKPKLISEIAKLAGVRHDELEFYGNYKAKVSLDLLKRLADRKDAKLINVTAITPTNAGEGKTCISIGLAQSLGKLKKKVILALREPSLGPVFGIKGGACGGGYSQVVPMEDINLHFTGDIHAIGAAHNLLSAMVENHVIHGNELGIDPETIIWPRAVDISDRQLRSIVVGCSGKGYLRRKSSYVITVASEIMAIMALAENMNDLKTRLGRIIVAYTNEGRPVSAKEIKAVGAMALLLKDALKPNLVQTLEGQPCFIHTGPFANIAHGNNSILATKMALKLGDYVVTESGFGADLGCEKFMNIVCRQANFKPDCVVLVVSVRAIKEHNGMANMDRHISNIQKFGVPVVVAINRFLSDSTEDLEKVKVHCNNKGITAVLSEVVIKGGAGGIKLAEAVLKALRDEPAHFKPLYPLDIPIEDKIDAIACKIYGANGVTYTPKAKEDIKILNYNGFSNLPINMARTQLSFTHNPKIKGAPKGWKLKVREVRLSAGAGFIVPVTGKMMLMPGLPKHPAAETIDISDKGEVVGLF